MKVNNIGSNMTEVDLEGGDSILISYKTPVAADINGHCFKTDRKWSKTTSRHINKWLDGLKAEEKPQEFFDNLLELKDIDYEGR